MRKMLALPGGRCDDALGHTDSSAVRKPTSLSTEGLAPLPNVPARWAWVTAGLRPLRGAVPPWGPPGGSTHTSSACLDLCTPKQVPPTQAVVPRCTAPSHAVGVGWDEPQQVKGRVWPALSITAMGSRGRPQPGNPAHPALVRGAHVKTCGSLGSGFPSPSLSTPHAGPARHWKSAQTLGTLPKAHCRQVCPWSLLSWSHSGYAVPSPPEATTPRAAHQAPADARLGGFWVTSLLLWPPAMCPGAEGQRVPEKPPSTPPCQASSLAEPHPTMPRTNTCGAGGTAGLMGGELPPVHVGRTHTLLARLGPGPGRKSTRVGMKGLVSAAGWRGGVPGGALPPILTPALSPRQNSALGSPECPSPRWLHSLGAAGYMPLWGCPRLWGPEHRDYYMQVSHPLPRFPSLPKWYL